MTMAINCFEYGTGGRCVYVYRYTYAGIRIIDIQMEKEDRHMGRVIHITRTPKRCIEFAGKEDREQKGGYKYKSKHKPRSARNTCRKTGRGTIYVVCIVYWIEVN